MFVERGDRWGGSVEQVHHIHKAHHKFDVCSFRLLFCSTLLLAVSLTECASEKTKSNNKNHATRERKDKPKAKHAEMAMHVIDIVVICHDNLSLGTHNTKLNLLELISLNINKINEYKWYSALWVVYWDKYTKTLKTMLLKWCNYNLVTILGLPLNHPYFVGGIPRVQICIKYCKKMKPRRGRGLQMYAKKNHKNINNRLVFTIYLNMNMSGIHSMS